MGDEYYDKAASDIIFEVREIPHKIFRRKNNLDLYMQLEITLEEALLGFEKSINHLDGHEVIFEKDSVTQPGYQEKIKGEGMPEHEYSSNYGDLYVTYVVKIPKSFTPAQMERKTKFTLGKVADFDSLGRIFHCRGNHICLRDLRGLRILRSLTVSEVFLKSRFWV